MLTVEDFKCLAGDVVAGDDLYQNPTPVEVEWAKYINNTPDFDHFTFKSFAWRPLNTLPDNPRFKYEQDDDKGLWRPLLDQSAVKPTNCAAVKPSDDKSIFTQEIGIDSVVTVNTVNGIKNGVVIGVFDRWYWVDVIGVGLKTYDRFLVSHLDTCTPKQKAVDEALEVIGIKSVEGGNARRWLDMLYDADKLKC